MKIDVQSDSDLMKLAINIATRSNEKFKSSCPQQYHNEMSPKWIYLCKTTDEADEMDRSSCLLCQVCEEIIIGYYGMSVGSGIGHRSHFVTQLIHHLVEKKNKNLIKLPMSPNCEVKTLGELESEYPIVFNRIFLALQKHQECTKKALMNYLGLPENTKIRIHRSIKERSEKDLPISSWSHRWTGRMDSYGNYLYTAASDFETIFSIAGQEFELLILSDSITSNKKIIKSFGVDLESGKIFNF